MDPLAEPIWPENGSINDRNQLSGNTAPLVDYTHIPTHCDREGDTGLLISFKCFTLCRYALVT